MRELVTVFGLPDKPMEVSVPKDLVSLLFLSPPSLPCPPLSSVYGTDSTNARLQNITTMSRYNAEFPFLIAFPPQAMTNVLAEWLGSQGVPQCHVAGALIFPFLCAL